MVVALGTAAKHSLFENSAHSTQYLKQSVKMVWCDDSPAVSALPDPAATFPVAPFRAVTALPPAPVFAGIPVLSPLLI